MSAKKTNTFWQANWKFFVSAFISVTISLITVFITLYYELWRTEHSVVCSFAGSYFDETGVEVRLVFENQGTESEVILGASFVIPDTSGSEYLSTTFWDMKLAPMLDDPFVLRSGEVVIKKYKWPITATKLHGCGFLNYDSALNVDLEVSFLNSNNYRSDKTLPGLTLSAQISSNNVFYCFPLGSEGPPSMTNKLYSASHPIRSIELFNNDSPSRWGLYKMHAKKHSL